MKKRYKFSIGFVIALLLAFCVVLFFTSTRQGIRLVTKKFLSDFVAADDIQVGSMTGQLSDELIFSNIELKNLKWFPTNTVIRIQRLIISLKSFNPQDIQVHFENIRVFMPYSDPIVLSGHFKQGLLTCNAYSSNVSIDEFLTLLPQKIASNPKGVLKDVDLYLEGPPNAINIKGTFFIDSLDMPKFTLSDAPGDLSLLFKRIASGFAPHGELRVTEGNVTTKNAVLKLEKSYLYFSGTFAEPRFDIKGNASIGKVDIDLALLGTPQAPQWRFSSDPPMAEGVLMLMFVTGKNLEGVQASFEENRLTPDLAKDLIDYFLLGGEGGRLAQKLGIKEVSIIYDKEKEVAGIGVKKEVTNFFDVGYQFEQQGLNKAETADHKHTLGAELKLNRHFSVEVDRELYQSHNQERFNEPIKTDDKVLLKYKTRF